MRDHAGGPSDLVGEVEQPPGPGEEIADAVDDPARQELRECVRVGGRVQRGVVEQVIEGQATAARVARYLGQGVLKARVTAVNIDRQLCRGCGDCIAVCPYIEMKVSDSGTACAAVDPILCLGCGACITSCPTGAITQPVQSDSSIISTLEALSDRPGKVGAMA